MEQKKKEDNNKEKNNKEENTINENIEQKEIEENIPVKKNYEFCLATKIGNKPDLMPKFLKSPAFKDIVNFLYNIQNKIKGIKLSDIPPKSNNKCLSNFENLFNSLEELYIKFPPKEGNEKYNIPVFKDFHTYLVQNYENIMMNSVLKLENIPKNLVLELKSYFIDSFGNPSRMDYGTGHELNFLCFLYVLYKADLYTENDFPFLALNIFFKYVIFMRKLQTNYVLEPAGARGVWGLDEYQFIPFIFGAAQLINNKEITPKGILDDEILKTYKNEYIYLDCVDYIKSVKTGASFGHYAPILESITNAKNWEKIAKGLVRMYQDDVLGKIVIIQHFYFGSVFLLE
jgi:serine/threonine-protein phosphatase 2A activator